MSSHGYTTLRVDRIMATAMFAAWTSVRRYLSVKIRGATVNIAMNIFALHIVLKLMLSVTSNFNVNTDPFKPVTFFETLIYKCTTFFMGR